MGIAQPDGELIVLTETGRGKRVALSSSGRSIAAGRASG